MPSLLENATAMRFIAKRHIPPLRLARSYSALIGIAILSLLLLSEEWRLRKAVEPTRRLASAASRNPVWDDSNIDQSEQAPTSSAKNSQMNPQVALMFMIRDTMPLEPVWTAFIAAAAELSLRAELYGPTPNSSVRLLPNTFIDPMIAATACWQFTDGTRLFRMPAHKFKSDVVEESTWDMADWLPDGCASTMTGSQLYAQQDLFSIYVHRSVLTQPFPDQSVFSGRVIPERTSTAYASPSLVTAMRLLLRAALSNHRNDKFVLLSESCLPLYHPALLWTQLIAERDSRTLLHSRAARWLDVMATDHMQQEHFKKASQWIALTRRHAIIVAYDNHVYPVMTAYCRTELHCNVTNSDGRKPARFCTSDEHYVPTVLSVYGESLLDTSTITYAKFHGGWSPKVHGQAVTVQDVYEMRAGLQDDDRCEIMPKAAMQSAAQLFLPNQRCASLLEHQGSSRSSQATSQIRSNNLFSQRHIARPRSIYFNRLRHLTAVPEDTLQHTMARDNLPPRSGEDSSSIELLYEQMSLHCPLFGRKFNADALESLRKMVWRCDGLGYALDCLSQAAVETGDA